MPVRLFIKVKTVLRDGEKVNTLNTGAADIDSLIQMMVGREVKEKHPKEKVKIGKKVLTVKDISCKHTVSNLNFSMQSGEILGVFGLVGSGRTELLRLLFGIYKKDTGQIFIDDDKIQINSPKDAIRQGMALVPEDRQDQGLIMGMTVSENSSLIQLKKLCKLGIINKGQELSAVNAMIEKLRIKTFGQEQKVKDLSGGNQQKVVLSK